MSLAKMVYSVTKNFSEEERYNLTNQLRKAAVSVPSNIAEGTSRKTDKAFSHFLDMALGSLFELETQMVLSYDLEYLNKNELNRLVENIVELQKMIFGFQKGLTN